MSSANLLSIGSNTRIVKQLTDELSLRVIQHKATHCPPGYDDLKTWIDVMCVDANDEILAFNNLVPPFHSRHNLIDVTIELFVTCPPITEFSFRKFNNISPEDINGILMDCD